jgi:hypothetical protein
VLSLELINVDETDGQMLRHIVNSMQYTTGLPRDVGSSTIRVARYGGKTQIDDQNDLYWTKPSTATDEQIVAAYVKMCNEAN